MNVECCGSCSDCIITPYRHHNSNLRIVEERVTNEMRQHSTHVSFDNKHPPEFLVKNVRRVYTTLLADQNALLGIRIFFFPRIALKL